VLHIKPKAGMLRKGDIVEMRVDSERRLAIAKNHTATHILQSCLRKVLGDHVQQQGSLVAPDRLRFDFTHFEALTDDEIKRVEELVNQQIKKAHPVSTDRMSLDDAKSSGALAFFGEKYDREVRVVSAGSDSQELCGGTHLENTAEIELFKITKEGSVASGIRRIEAVTSDAAKQWLKKYHELQQQKQEALHEKEKKKQRQKQKASQAVENVDEILKETETAGDISIIASKLADSGADILKKLSDAIRKRKKEKYALFLVSDSEKPALLLSLSDDIVKKGKDASSIIRDIASLAGGSGGGRPNMALGGIRDASKIDYILSEAKKILIKEIG
jgi:alanyl-tRNA synthetase